MAYQKGYVVSIIPTKTNKPVREHSENGERVCKLEFDSEYKIRLKNTTGAPALASIIIDGTPISTAGDFIINHGDTVDVERFVDSLSIGKKFKFVRKDHTEIQDPTVSELGLIEVMFTPARYKHGLSWDVLGTLNNPGTPKMPHYTIGPSMWSGHSGAIYTNNMTNRGDVISTDYIGVIEGCNTSVGGTIGGAESAQKFTTTSNYEANGTTEIIKLRLRGPEAATVTVPDESKHTVFAGGFTYENGQLHHNGLPVGKAVVTKVEGSNIYIKLEVPIGHIKLSMKV